MAPSTTKQWTVEGKSGFDSLKFHDKAEIPTLGDHDVLINFHYASLNYRDLIIPMGKYPFPIALPIIPASDGAGTVVATGSRVSRFHKGDGVLTLFNQSHLAGPITPSDTLTGLGGALHGVLRQYGVFEESGLVLMPSTLNFQQGSTLPCAALTAWNGLYGIEGKSLKPGDTVLTQGTGGVSMFTLQFAKAAGARVISTTSSDAKAEVLKKLGADHVINYKTDENWGETAKKLTPGGIGCAHVIEVGGPKTMAQSLKAIRPEGTISIIGFLGGFSKDQPSFLDCLNNICTVRGVLVGSRQQFEQMNEAIDANGIKPVVDEKVFGLEETKEAYQYMWDQKHFGKLTIKIDDPSQSKL
ncbi:hypothetical protein HO133_007414 [Letharia lupina]|uniref:Enoyl reductase (ER) domain-containing protein n=1 Tax=Letharia lupina TaxID=560253 RepID=A0A8H6FIQ0_9LECA|nr:uncharacterized protein HO133_007414 [Letharia lupina]KAF6229298.1 hypothetical protein HO133_007414 [Letharia lupina]